MTTQEHIELNQIKQARFKKYTGILRRVRLKIFDYDDQGKPEKAQRVMAKCQSILAPFWDAHRRNIQAQKLERTPSAFEPGGRG